MQLTELIESLNREGVQGIILFPTGSAYLVTGAGTFPFRNVLEIEIGLGRAKETIAPVPTTSTISDAT